MPRHLRCRLVVCLLTAATTTALGAVTAPAASAEPGPSDAVLQHLSQRTSSVAPGQLANVPNLGRKL